MVRTPWFDREIPFEEAAEIGTRKVIQEHSTIGLVVVTDGSITDLPRSSYIEAEERVIRELNDLGKPYLGPAQLDSTRKPGHPPARARARRELRRHGLSCQLLGDDRSRYP